MATIRQFPNGNWQAIVRRRGSKPVSKTFKTNVEAARWGRLIESEIDRGVFVDRVEAERTTIAALIDRYLAKVTPRKKSARQEKQRLLFLKRHFGPFSAAALRNYHVSEYRDRRLAEGLAGATVVKEMNSLAHLFNKAIRDWGMPLVANPVTQVGRPQVARGRDRRLSSHELTMLLAACRESRSPMLETIVVVAIETGMRLGELLALDWRHIDRTTRVATLPDTKTGEARRVPLSPKALSALDALPRHIGTSRVFWRWGRSDSLENAWRRAVAKAGIDDLHFHDLRHEATSRLFERGLALPEVAAITGHKTWQMLRRYTHLDPTQLAEKLC